MKYLFVSVLLVALTACSNGGSSSTDGGGSDTSGMVDTLTVDNQQAYAAISGIYENTDTDTGCVYSIIIGENGQYRYTFGGSSAEGTLTITRRLDDSQYNVVFDLDTSTGTDTEMCAPRLLPVLQDGRRVILTTSSNSPGVLDLRISDASTSEVYAAFTRIGDAVGFVSNGNTGSTGGGGEGTACLPGTWIADNEAYLEEIQRTMFEGSDVTSLEGVVTMQLSSDGQGTGNFNNFTINFSDENGTLTSVTMNGNGTFSWSADETTYFASQSSLQLQTTSTIEIEGMTIEIDLGDLFQAEDFIGAEQGAEYACNGNRLVFSPEELNGSSVPYNRR